MNTKLTLTIEEEIIKVAKSYAKEHGQSLSEIVENYFKLITAHKPEEKTEQLSPRVKKLRGIIKTSETIDEKKILMEELERKYGA